MSSPRGVPTSRAYWDLKAEQMLNRVFSRDTPIEVEIVETSEPAPARHGAAPPERSRRRRSAHALAALLQRRPELVPISVAAAGLGTALVTVLMLGFWSSQQQALRQERNLVLLERLRAMGPGSGAAAEPPSPLATPAQGEASAALPPPPPSEPWMEELAQLPAGGAPRAEVLKVPFTPGISTPAPAVGSAGGGSPAGAAESLPQLVGVVQIPGRSGSAIFQVGGTSTNASVGDSIAGSGWRLRSAAGDSAVIERGGQLRRVSISSGF